MYLVLIELLHDAVFVFTAHLTMDESDSEMWKNPESISCMLVAEAISRVSDSSTSGDIQ